MSTSFRATTRDVGLAIRDLLEGQWISVLIKDVEHQAARKVHFVDVSDANNPVFHLDNGQQFILRIIASEKANKAMLPKV